MNCELVPVAPIDARTDLGMPSWEPLELAVTESGRGELAVVRVAGEIDVSTAWSLKGCLDLLLRGGRSVILDFEGVSFMGAAGIGVLVAAHRLAEESATTVTLRRPIPSVVRLLAITNLLDVIAVERADPFSGAE